MNDKNLTDRDIDEILDELREEIVIPEVVQKKAADAFEIIRREASMTAAAESGAEMAARRKKSVRHRRARRKIWIFAAAAVLVFGTLNVAVGAYRQWSKSLGEGLKAKEPQQQKLQENHMASFISQACTDQGITVTAFQSITDNYYTHISFKVDGYNTETGVQPEFGAVSVTVDGDSDFSWVSSFYDGLVMGEDGTIERADKKPILKDENGSIISNYAMDDGSLEYHMTLFNSGQKGYFLNKPIRVELKGLGTVERAEYQERIAGKWAFDWTLEGSSEARNCDLNAPLGDSGAVVTRAEISPISMWVEYDFPRQERQDAYLDEHGQERTGTFLKEPPRLRGVVMKDGTVYSNLFLGPGSDGYESESGSRYRTTFAIDRILDTSQVESLLFARPASENTGSSPEEPYYIVPIG